MDARIARAMRNEELSKTRKPILNKVKPTPSFKQHAKPVNRQYVLSIKKGNCFGCGAHLQSDDASRPGYVPPEILNRVLNPMPTQDILEHGISDYVNLFKHSSPQEQATEPRSVKKDSVEHLMDVLGVSEDELVAEDNDLVGEESEMDLALKLKLEKQAEKEKELATCQRCHRLRNYGVVADDMRPGWSQHSDLTPQHFAKLLANIKNTKCVVVTLVDVFDFDGSIIPNLKEIIGQNPLHIAVNKVL
jgi:hypothetical protein